MKKIANRFLTSGLITLCMILIFSACNKAASNSNKASANTNTSKAAAPVDNSNVAQNTSSGAQTYTHSEAGIQFEAPAGWQAKQDGDQMTLTSPDGGVAVVFQVAEEDTWEQAIDAVDEELGKVIHNSQPEGEPMKGTHNGMSFVSQSGAGTVDGKKVEWQVTLLDAKKPVIVLGFADPETWSKNEAAYTKLVESIRKA